MVIKKPVLTIKEKAQVKMYAVNFRNWKKAQKKRIKADAKLAQYIRWGKPANMTTAQYKQKIATLERAWRKACSEEGDISIIIQKEGMKARQGIYEAIEKERKNKKK